MKDFRAAPLLLLLLLLPYHSSTSAAEAAQRTVHIHHLVCFLAFFIVALAQSRKQVVGCVDVCWGLLWIIADKVLWEHCGVGALAGALQRSGFFFFSMRLLCIPIDVYQKWRLTFTLFKSDQWYFLHEEHLSQMFFFPSLVLWLF